MLWMVVWTCSVALAAEETIKRLLPSPTRRVARPRRGVWVMTTCCTELARFSPRLVYSCSPGFLSVNVTA